MKNLRYIVAFLALLILGSGLLALPAVVRALPGRYASLLPAPLQALRHTDHPVTLPTPMARPTELIITPTSPTATPTLERSVDPSPTPASSATPAPTETPNPTPTATPPAPDRVFLEGGRHERQGWNNCGPTTLAMALSFWGIDDRQTDIAPLLKPDPEDKHVGIYQMADYAERRGLRTIVRSGGTLDGLKRLLHAGFPVIVRTWYVRDARDQLGHYRLVIGYDDATQTFDLFDSLYDPPTTMAYDELYELWRVFNWSYLVVAPPARWDDVASLIGPDTDDEAMYERALARIEAEITAPPSACVAYAACSDWVAYGWLAAGTNLTALGRHVEAAHAYDQARQLGLHYRLTWYVFGLYESYYEIGRYDDVVGLATATLATAANLEESYYWRAKARLAQGDTAGAMSDLETALRYHRGWQPATALLAAIAP